MDDTIPDTPEDENVKLELEDAMKQMHPEEQMSEDDPFAVDGLGNEPAEENDLGSVD
jgi:hypothetical protein